MTQRLAPAARTSFFGTSALGLTTLILVLISPMKVVAQTDAAAAEDEVVPASSEDLTPVTVYGRGLSLVGQAQAASEGVVGYRDFEDRPLSRVGELAEVVPGVVATQHSGEGKGNQFFLRGFNLDHGTDFSVAVDGVPINLRPHGHGQGYLDLNFVIPELVERVDFRKGPYFADAGDFSAAGSARYKTRDQIERFAQLGVGEGDYLRSVVAGSYEMQDQSDLLLAVEAQRYDGPWALDQDLEKLNAFAKLTKATANAEYRFVLNAYDSDWTATDQIPQRSVDRGDIDRFGFIDDDLGGETTRASLSGSATFSRANGATTSLTAYAVGYDFRLFSNFTYFLDNPVLGDEFEQRDRRHYFGAALSHALPLSDISALTLGVETRYDDIQSVGLFPTIARQRVGLTRDDEVEQLSLAAYAKLDLQINARLRAQLGLRGDYYDADVTATRAANSGSADDSLLSPSLGLAWRSNDSLELYANAGRGFHSNDVRGATITVDPVSDEAVEPVPILVAATGAELGTRIEAGTTRFTAALFWLELDSELVFVGDAGTTEANDGSRRYGIESTAFWQPTDWLTLDASAAYTDAKFDIPGPADEIPGAVERVVSFGAIADYDQLTLSARLRHFGSAPLIEDGSVSSSPTTVLNLAAFYDWPNVQLGLELLNALDSNDADITYFFESQLPGEANPVADRHFHPVEPRQLRATVRYRF